jgi:uncharacterized DUF497 family protein
MIIPRAVRLDRARPRRTVSPATRGSYYVPGVGSLACSFEQIVRRPQLEWPKAVIAVDDRFMYGEERLIAFAPLRGRLYAVCYVQRGEVRRIVSFRKANKREERLYAQATADE